MQARCPPPGKLGVLEKLDFTLRSRTTCMNTAKSMYRAVREYGEERFSGEMVSSVCFYDGPASEDLPPAAPADAGRPPRPR